MADKQQISYRDAGVDTAEGARAVDAIRKDVQSTYRPEVVGDIGGFGGLFSAMALKNMHEPLLVSGADGVGTKIELARQMGVFNTVGIDLVAMCANDVLVCGAEPLFFLDYIAAGKIESERMAELVSGVAEGCRQAGCALIGGEMAEHPGVMAADEFDMSGFCVGVVDRPQMVDGSALASGDVILGFPSSGLHSNGFSLVRRVLNEGGLSLDESYPELAGDDSAAGADRVSDGGANDGGASGMQQTLGEALLTPTRLYARTVLGLLRAGLPIKGMAHITGGGITENLDRVLPTGLDALVNTESWEIPPVIRFVCEQAGLSQDEALRTFNCGIGFALIVAAEDAPTIKDALLSGGEPVYEIGRVVPGSGKVRYEERPA